MNSADLALAAFTACNSVRVFAYVPQLVKIGRDNDGATAISYATWGMFALSHLSTVGYAVFAVGDWKMGAVFTANALCCAAILALTAYKRRRAALQGRAAQGPACGSLDALRDAPPALSRRNSTNDNREALLARRTRYSWLRVGRRSGRQPA
jgi:hypothetical protein